MCWIFLQEILLTAFYIVTAFRSCVQVALAQNVGFLVVHAHFALRNSYTGETIRP